MQISKDTSRTGEKMNTSRSAGASSPVNGKQVNDWDTRRKRKIADIKQALSASPVDVAALRRMAISEGGLLTDEIRCQVWPRLLNVPPHVLEQEPETVERENNKDYNQVLLDVQRSLRRFPPGERLATALVEKLSTHHLRDFMDPTMDNTKHILNYLMPIIDRVNPEVHDFMQQAEVGTVFALSWLITWFGHVLSDFRHVVRLYDFFLACHPLMPIYFAAVIVLYREEEVLECECDMAMVHHLLSQIPQDLPYETLISRAGDLFVQFPPSELAREAASHDGMAASTFKDFDLASTQQRPDSVLRRRRRQKQATLESSAANAAVTVARPSAARRLVRLAVMGLTVALGAAALAVVNTALEWAPKLDLFP
ncbi:TBC1 domain family member 20 isoform X2 [Sander vitreus]